MDRLKGIIGSTGFRIWIRTVMPTSVIFVLAAAMLRIAVRRRLNQIAPGSEIVFDQVFAGEYIGWGALAALAVSTVLTVFFTELGLQPYRTVIRLTKELAAGNYGVRAEPKCLMGQDYREMADNVNALAESLERTDRLRRELVSNLAHEIRTPLTNLQGYLEALRDGVIEANQEALSSVHEEVMRLVRLVDALHQLARADAMRSMNLERTPTDLDHMAEQLARVIRPTAEARGIRVFLDLTAQRMPVPVHADSIAQVMRNLLRNAVQYAEDGGVVRVQTSGSHGIYRFAVLNTGPGIDEQDLPFVFNRFFRSEKARQGVKTGVGIGLSIVKEVVEAHGGRVGAQSKAGWTMVWFEVPTTPGVKLEPEEPGIRV